MKLACPPAYFIPLGRSRAAFSYFHSPMWEVFRMGLMFLPHTLKEAIETVTAAVMLCIAVRQLIRENKEPRRKRRR